MKVLKFLGSSLADLRKLPIDVRRHVGFELARVQRDDNPSDWKPMQAIGIGVKEIKIKVSGDWRVIYVAKFAEAIYVLHIFQKKTQKTRQNDIDMARKRYREIGMQNDHKND